MTRKWDDPAAGGRGRARREHKYRDGQEYKHAAARPQAFVIDLAEARMQRDVEQLHRLGPRVLHAFLSELGADRMITTVIEEKLRRYRGIDANVLHALPGKQP
jgi:hypothetical protein